MSGLDIIEALRPAGHQSWEYPGCDTTRNFFTELQSNDKIIDLIEDQPPLYILY
jgi:hypothetical protein